MVYIREAYPTGGWQVGVNVRDGVAIKQPKSFGERLDSANKMCSALKLHLPAVINDLNDKVNRDYAAWPDRLYLIDRDGKIAYQSRPGPRGFRPTELQKAIERELDRS